MRNENKLIEEMAEMLDIIAKAREEYANDITDHTENEYIREGLLNANYRKQSKGEWESFEIPHMIRCSVCNVSTLAIHQQYFNFCPNCGAKMFVRMTHTCPHNIPNLIPTIEEMTGGAE